MELWKLGDPGPFPKPSCLLKVRAPEGEAIARCTVSADGRWIAYCTANKLRLLQVQTLSTERKKWQVSVNKVKSLPAACHSALCFVFTPDVTKLVVATPSGDLLVLSVSEEVEVLHTASLEELGLREPPHVMAVNAESRMLAAADHSGRTCVFDLILNKLLFSLPKRKFQATALGFHPSTNDLVVAYSDGMIQEVDSIIGSYTKFGRSLEGPLISGHGVISDISFDVAQPQMIIVRTEDILCIVNKEQMMSGIVTNDKGRYGPGISVCDTFEHLAYGGNLGSAGTLLMVEVTPEHLALQLPPVLKIHRFGA
jgi:hypothetical protein